MGLIELDGFSFDLGPTILMMPHVYKSVFEYCGRNPDDYFQITKLDPIYKVYFNDGSVHEATSELSGLVKELEKISEQDTQGYLAYLAEIYKRYLVAKDFFITKTFNNAGDLLNPSTIAAAFKLKTFNNAYSMISKFVKNEKLRELLSFQTMYIGISPFNGPSIYTIIPMIELIYGVWFMKGGMRSYVKALERLFIELGGKIHLNSPVRKIVLDGHKVSGIEVNDNLISGDIVLNTADFMYAIKELLPESFQHGRYKKQNINAYEYACSCFMLYIGLNKRSFPGLNVHNLAFAKDFSNNINEIFNGSIPSDPSIYVYAPAIEDESLAPPGQLGIYVLAPVPNLKEGSSINWNNKSLIDSFRLKIFEKIRRIKPLADFENHIVTEKLFTPLDFSENFNVSFGATFGLRPTLFQSNNFRPQPKAIRYKNLYFAGSSIHPGAGVPIVLTSAELAVSEILNDEKN